MKNSSIFKKFKNTCLPYLKYNVKTRVNKAINSMLYIIYNEFKLYMLI